MRPRAGAGLRDVSGSGRPRFGQPARQREVAEFVEIENVAREAQRPFANLGRLLRAVRGEVAVELRFERRQIPVEEIEQGDPVFVLFESGARRQRREKVGVDDAAHEPVGPRAVLEPVGAQRRQIVDDGDAVVADGDAAAAGRIEVQIEPDLPCPPLVEARARGRRRAGAAGGFATA